MLWALLFSLIFGSSNNLMMIPKFNKYAKRNIEDKERLDQVLKYRKETKAEKKAFRKRDKKELKTYDKLYTDASVSNDSIYYYFSKHIENERDFLIDGLDLTIKAKSHILEPEWNAIVDDFKDDQKKVIKYHNKIRKKVNKYLDKLNEIDVDNDKQLEEEIKQFTDSTKACLEERIGLQLPYNEVLLLYNCSRDQYIIEIDSLINNKYKMLDNQLQLRTILINNLSSTELKKAIKQVEKIDY